MIGAAHLEPPHRIRVADAGPAGAGAARRAARGGLLLALIVAIGALAALAPTARAQDGADRRRAAEHFDRGIAFFNERRYDAALAELARAHELAPAHQTVYNLARVHAALGHAVEAARAYEQYLAEAGGSLDASRRREAEAALAEQRSRIGRLRVRADIDGATVAIDGVDVTTTPLSAPIELSAGTHNVELRAPGHETVRRAVSIAGESESDLEVVLREEVVPRGTLRVNASLPEVGVSVDGEPIGVTPLSSTVSLRAGPHVVRASRPGYVPEERHITIEEGAETELELDLRREPTPSPEEVGRLRLALPNAPYLIRVDGETMLGDELDLPVGAHDVRIEVTDRQPYQGTLRVPAGSAIIVVPPLSWTLDARQERLRGAEGQRVAGLVLTAIGGAALVAGVALLIWNEPEIERTNQHIEELNARIAPCIGRDFTLDCMNAEEEGEQIAAEVIPMQDAVRGVSIALTALGAGMAALGLGLWIAAPSEDAVDAAAQARARLSLTPGGLTLDGGF